MKGGDKKMSSEYEPRPTNGKQPISEEQKKILLKDLNQVEGLPELLLQEGAGLDKVTQHLEQRHDYLLGEFERGLKGLYQIEERGCRLALRAIANNQLTLEDLKMVKQVALKKAQEKLELEKSKKRKFLGSLFGR